jgi:hypothetical protein
VTTELNGEKRNMLFGEWNVTVGNGFNLLSFDEGNITVAGSSLIYQTSTSFSEPSHPSFVECLLRNAPKLEEKNYYLA